MLKPDLYDVHVAFDDIYEMPENEVLGARPNLLPTFRKTIAKAKSRRLRTPLKIGKLSHDPTAKSFQLPAGYEVLGSDLECAPLYSKLRSSYARMMPTRKVFRVDTPESYAAFRDERRLPYWADLEARLSALECAFAQHAGDKHSDRINDLEAEFDEHMSRYHSRHPDDVVGEVTEAAKKVSAGGVKIQPAPGRFGKDFAWQDEDEILYTLRFKDKNGTERFVTSGTPFERHLEAVIECSCGQLGDVAPAASYMAQVLGTSELFGELSQIVPILSTNSEPSVIIGLMIPASDPDCAAAVDLLQRCTQGDRTAVSEARRLRETHRELLGHAAVDLTNIKRAKAIGALR